MNYSLLVKKSLQCASSLFLLIGASAAVMQSAAAREAQADDKPAMIFEAGQSSSGWLPFTLEDGVRIFIPATVNGRAVRVMLDSGASVSVLDNRFVKSLGLTAIGDLTAQGAGGTGQYGEVSGVTIQLGALTISNSRTVGVDLQTLEQQIRHPLPMVLGGAAFDHHVVEIDFPNKRLAFHDPDRFQPRLDAPPLQLFAAGDNRAIDIEIENRPARMLFDLGNAWPAVLYPRFWNNAAFLSSRRVTSTLSGGWGGMHSEGLSRVHNIRIGKAEFHAVPAPLKGERTEHERAGLLDGNIGMPLLSRFHLIVDFPKQRVYFNGPADTQSPFEANTTGLAVQRDGTAATILHVAKHSPAERAGLQTGDVIVSLTDADGADIALTSSWTRRAAGDLLYLTLQDGRIVALRSEDYF